MLVDSGRFSISRDPFRLSLKVHARTQYPVMKLRSTAISCDILDLLPVRALLGSEWMIEGDPVVCSSTQTMLDLVRLLYYDIAC